MALTSRRRRIVHGLVCRCPPLDAAICIVLLMVVHVDWFKTSSSYVSATLIPTTPTNSLLQDTDERSQLQQQCTAAINIDSSFADDGNPFDDYDLMTTRSYSHTHRILLHQNLRGGKDDEQTDAVVVEDDIPKQQQQQQAQEDPVLPDDDEIYTTTFYGNISIPLHAHSGSHHVYVYVGSPPQRVVLIVDTGSRLMSFSCVPCKKSSCGKHVSPYYYDPKLSMSNTISTCGNCKLSGISTCSLYNENCILHSKYTEGSSWNGIEMEDIVWFATSDVEESIEYYMTPLGINYVFGCQTSSKGLFRTQYGDGILGLARHESSSIIRKMYKDTYGIMERNAFSLCLTRTGGYLTLGGSLMTTQDTTKSQPKMRFTPISKELGWYSIELVAMYVGDIPLAKKKEGEPDAASAAAGDGKQPRLRQNDLSLEHALEVINGGRQLILDSGATDTYLPWILKDPFIEIASELSNGLLNRATVASNTKQQTKSYTYEEFLTLPNITFVFVNNVELIMTPAHYMEGNVSPKYELTEQQENGNGGGGDHIHDVRPWKGSKPLTFRIYFEESNGAVLGSNAMFNHDILFDEQGHQVGIVASNCYIPPPPTPKQTMTTATAGGAASG